MIRMKHVLFAAVLVAAAISSTGTAQAPPQPNEKRVALESVTSAKPLPEGIEVQAGSATIRITALRDDIVRFRIAPGSALPEDASWAVLPEARTKSVNVQPLGDAHAVGF